MASDAASNGNGVQVRELTVAADEGQLGRVRDFVVEVCEDAGFSAREASNTKLAVDEACTNIIKHAYSGDAARGDITVRAEIGEGGVNIKLRDTGDHFDFASIKDPDLDQYVETGKKGGLGVFLINRLMDGVEYHATDGGNELVLTKRSQAAIASGVLPAKRPLTGTLRFKFTMRAAGGLFLLMAAVWAFIFIRQTNDIKLERTARWMEQRRVAENLSRQSVDLLLEPDEFSIEQTNMSSDLSRLVANNEEIAYARVVNNNGEISASGDIDEIFTHNKEPDGEVLSNQNDRVIWRHGYVDGHRIRDIACAVRFLNPDGGATRQLGWVHLGVYEDAVEASVDDNRLMTSLIQLGIFALGILLIMGLVRVFVRPIQVLTDGVRAIGDGTLDQKLEIDGPAEIGAIASVFNEITDKFKRAQTSILEQEKMQKEMEVAKEIQHSLLPRRKPELSGYDIAPLYQAAAEVGGDYYDFVQVDDDTVGVVVADVSGKGVPGSLVMTMIRTALRMEARGNKNASDVMAKMNAFVTDDMKKGMFVTMFYVILDSKNRIISYASAGHNPMILYRHQTRETYFLNPKGFPVGISLPDEELFRKSISLEKIKLKKDDMLLIYTDGVTEAMNERREQYGEDRLLEIIRTHGHLHPEDFIARLEASVKKFTAGYPQNDDITVVAVKEKLAADDVLFGIRKKLIDLVDVQGMSVKEACRQMRVSPATYYRYKKRLEVMGERGLKNKVLREDITLKRLSLEARKEMLQIIAEHPEWGAKRIANAYNEGKSESQQVTDRMVYDELKRLNINTKELRIDYLKRNRLLSDEDESLVSEKSKELIDDLLGDIEGVESEAAEEAEAPVSQESATPTIPSPRFEEIDGVGLSVSHAGDVVVIGVNGHIDSVTSGTLERRIREILETGASKLVVDLGDVNYISSGGWGIFTGEVAGLRRMGGDIVLAGMSSEVYDVYELLGFADVLRACAEVEDAVAYFALPAEERLNAPLPGASKPSASLLSVEGDTDAPVTYGGEWESLRIEATTVGEQGDIAVLSLGGIIDTVSAETLRSALHRVISEGIYKVVVDMSSVEYVSSGGWGTFTERLRDVRRRGGDIKLFGMDPDVYYVFTMLGFNIVLSSFDILTEAIEDFARESTRPSEVEEHIEVDAGEALATPVPKPAAVTDVPAEGDGPKIRWESIDDNVVVARIAGSIEASTLNPLTTSMIQQLDRRPHGVMFDLSKVNYISSSGWGQFAHCYELCQAWNGQVVLFGMNQDLHEIYSCLEFSEFLRAYPSETDALHALSGSRGDTGTVSPPVSSYADPPEDPAEPSGPSIVNRPTIGDDVVSVDDVLGTDTPSVPPPPEPSTPAGSGNWPGETPKPAAPEVPSGDGDRTADTKETEPAHDDDGVMRGDVPFADISKRDGVDVDDAVDDKNVDRDRKLRDIGWGKYGERLRQRNRPGKHDEDDD